MLRVGLTGGIGSGKSTAARVFSTLGVPVYDSDANAKRLMITDPALSAAITSRFGAEAYRDGTLDRKFLASRVFTDKHSLADLNAIVHPAVMADFDRWANTHDEQGAPYVIQENAILFEGNFDRFMDYSITVNTPLDQRVERASQRDGSDPQRIRERVANQMTDQERESRADYILYNADNDLLTPQVVELHERLTTMAARQ